MKLYKSLALSLVLSFFYVACDKKTEPKDVKKEVLAAKMENVSLHVSGMTCEIGCAKIIQSKLSKKDGVANAKVIFTDSIAKVEFDSNKISKSEIITFIDGIAGGDLYKASEIEVKE